MIKDMSQYITLTSEGVPVQIMNLSMERGREQSVPTTLVTQYPVYTESTPVYRGPHHIPHPVRYRVTQTEFIDDILTLVTTGGFSARMEEALDREVMDKIRCLCDGAIHLFRVKELNDPLRIYRVVQDLIMAMSSPYYRSNEGNLSAWDIEDNLNSMMPFVDSIVTNYRSNNFHRKGDLKVKYIGLVEKDEVYPKPVSDLLRVVYEDDTILYYNKDGYRTRVENAARRYSDSLSVSRKGAVWTDIFPGNWKFYLSEADIKKLEFVYALLDKVNKVERINKYDPELGEFQRV